VDSPTTGVLESKYQKMLPSITDVLQSCPLKMKKPISVPCRKCGIHYTPDKHILVNTSLTQVIITRDRFANSLKCQTGLQIETPCFYLQPRLFQTRLSNPIGRLVITEYHSCTIS